MANPTPTENHFFAWGFSHCPGIRNCTANLLLRSDCGYIVAGQHFPSPHHFQCWHRPVCSPVPSPPMGISVLPAPCRLEPFCCWCCPVPSILKECKHRLSMLVRRGGTLKSFGLLTTPYVNNIGFCLLFCFSDRIWCSSDCLWTWYVIEVGLELGNVWMLGFLWCVMTCNFFQCWRSNLGLCTS